MTNSKPTANELITFLTAATEHKITVDTLRTMLHLVKEVGGAERALQMATMLAELRKTLKTDDQIKAVLTALHGSPF